MIRDRLGGRIITLEESHLRLKAEVSKVGGCHWVCVEKDGWLGFRSPIAGTYIGHDGKGKFCARAFDHKEWEYFSTRSHPDGGYLLLMRHWSKLYKMDIDKNGNELVETENKGTVWEFVKVGKDEKGR
jgi:hypothetical protein